MSLNKRVELMRAAHDRPAGLPHIRRLPRQRAAGWRAHSSRAYRYTTDMRMLGLSTRILIALALSSWASGCVMPYSREFKPKRDTVIGNEAATKFYRLKLSTRLVDARTREEIRDAKAIIVISWTKYSSAADSASSSPRRPRVEVESFSDLDSVTYSQSGLLLLPFYDFAADYTGASIYIYRSGYDPVSYVVALRPVGDEQVQRDIDAILGWCTGRRSLSGYPLAGRDMVDVSLQDAFQTMLYCPSLADRESAPRTLAATGYCQ